MAYLLLIFTLSHLISDYVMQTNKISSLKSKSIKGVLLHIGITLIVSCAIHISFFGLLGVYAAVIISVLHFLIDLLKFKVAPKFGRHQLIYFFIDQSMHFASLLLVAYIFRDTVMTFGNEWYVISASILICGWILAVPVSTIIAKQLLFDIGLQSFSAGDKFFMEGERVSDGVYLTAIFLLGVGGFISGQYILVFLGLSNLFFILHQNKKIYKDNKAYALKVFVYAVWVSITMVGTINFYNYFANLLT